MSTNQQLETIVNKLTKIECDLEKTMTAIERIEARFDEHFGPVLSHNEVDEIVEEARQSGKLNAFK